MSFLNLQIPLNWFISSSPEELSEIRKKRKLVDGLILSRLIISVVFLRMDDEPNASSASIHTNGEETKKCKRAETLYGLLHCLISTILFPDPNTPAASTPFLHRIKISVSDNAPYVQEASRNTCQNVLLWTRRGSPLRAVFVISVSNIFCFLILLYLLITVRFYLLASYGSKYSYKAYKLFLIFLILVYNKLFLIFLIFGLSLIRWILYFLNIFVAFSNLWIVTLSRKVLRIFKQLFLQHIWNR